jgi:hypothetical protein
VAWQLAGEDFENGLSFDNIGKNGRYREFAWQA